LMIRSMLIGFCAMTDTIENKLNKINIFLFIVIIGNTHRCPLALFVSF